MLQPTLKENHEPPVAHVSEYSLIFGSNETINSIKWDFYRVLTLRVTSLPTYFHPRNNFHREKIENNTYTASYAISGHGVEPSAQ